MGATFATEPALPDEHLRASPELRWRNRGTHIDFSTCILEQKWISDDGRRFKWCPVPWVFE